ncbi:beta-lactamase [Pseudonocardia sp. N23]|nr:beta-lactamase [Pseudonocardia sp. N23]
MTHADSVLYEGCFGLADVEWRQPVTPETMFGLGSVTKPATALAVMLTSRAGMLDLDSTVAEHLPSVGGPGASATIRQLLTHTSGIPNFLALRGFRERIEPLVRTSDDMLAAFAAEPLDFEAGTRWAYSDSGYRLLDVILSAVTATPFDRALADLVLRPAGMATACIPADDAVVPNRARGYLRDNGVVRVVPPTRTVVSGGAGGLVASLRDMVAFDRAVRRNRLVDEGTDRSMLAPVRLQSGHSEGYGLGWVLSTFRGAQAAGHTGGIGGFSSMYARFPRLDAGVIVLSNDAGFPASLLAHEVAAVALDLPGPDATDGCGPAPALCAGRYSDGWSEAELVVDGDTLVLRGEAGDRRMRHRAGPTWFDPGDPDVTLALDRVGATESAITVRYPFSWWTGYRDRAASSTASTMPV